MDYKNAIFIYCLSLSLIACSGGNSGDLSPLGGYGIHRGELVKAQDDFFKETVFIATTFKDRNGQQQTYGCTGVVLSKRHILTAAHCIFKKPDSRDVAHYVLQKFNVSEASFMDYVRVKDYRINKLYVDEARLPEHDLAVLLLDSALKDAVPAKLNYEKLNTEASQIFTVAGYGDYDHNANDLKLRYTTTKQSFGLNPGHKILWLSPANGCPLHGDSGGPAYLLGKDGVMRIVGIASALAGKENVLGSCQEYVRYMTISEYKDFIEESLAALK